MRIVALDLSLTSAGVSVLDNGNSRRLFAVQPKKEWPIQQRIHTIVSDIIMEVEYNSIVVIEDYAYGARPGSSSLATLGELGGIIKYIAWRKTGEWPITIASTTIKKWLSGSGNMPKDAFKFWGLKTFGIEPGTTDEVVAYALSDLIWNIYRRHQLEGIEKWRLKHLDSLIKQNPKLQSIANSSIL